MAWVILYVILRRAGGFHFQKPINRKTEAENNKHQWAETLVVGTLTTMRHLSFRPQRVFPSTAMHWKSWHGNKWHLTHRRVNSLDICFSNRRRNWDGWKPWQKKPHACSYICANLKTQKSLNTARCSIIFSSCCGTKRRCDCLGALEMFRAQGF